MRVILHSKIKKKKNSICIVSFAVTFVFLCDQINA